MVEFGVALVCTGIAVAVGALLTSEWGEPDRDYVTFYITAIALAAAGILAAAGQAWAGRLPEIMDPLADDPGGVAPQEDHNLRTAVTASHELIANQFNTSGGLDAQLIGLLVVFATSGGVFAVVHRALNANRWILLAGVCVAAAVCLVGLLSAPELEGGPVPAKFFERFGGAHHSGYLAQLLSDLSEIIVANDRAVLRRRGALNVAVLVLVAAGIVWGIVQAI